MTPFIGKNNRKNARVLVTGGAGFVGSRIVKFLLENGYKVTVLDNLSRGNRVAVPKEVKFIKGDIRSKIDVRKALVGVDCVIHCAAKLIIPESFKEPSAFIETNVLGTVNLMDAMVEAGVKYIVFSSSAGVYSETNHSPIVEGDRTGPYSPYGDTKLAMEKLMHAYHLSHGMNVTILRYFNPYGPGYLEKPEHVVPVFFEKAMKNEDFPVYGDGSMQRDYIYIDDVATAHLKAMKLEGFRVYNIGGGKGTKIIDLVKAITKVTKSKSKIKHVKTPPGYPDKMFADISKIKRELGWKPKVSIEEGIKRTYEEFYKNRKK